MNTYQDEMTSRCFICGESFTGATSKALEWSRTHRSEAHPSYVKIAPPRLMVVEEDAGLDRPPAEMPNTGTVLSSQPILVPSARSSRTARATMMLTFGGSGIAVSFAPTAPLAPTLAMARTCWQPVPIPRRSTSRSCRRRRTRLAPGYDPPPIRDEGLSLEMAARETSEIIAGLLAGHDPEAFRHQILWIVSYLVHFEDEPYRKFKGVEFLPEPFRWWLALVVTACCVLAFSHDEAEWGLALAAIKRHSTPAHYRACVGYVVDRLLELNQKERRRDILEEVERTRHLSVRKAALETGIPKSTISDYRKQLSA